MAPTDHADGRTTPAMRYAFSTLGVPGMPVPEVLRLATETGYQGWSCGPIRRNRCIR